MLRMAAKVDVVLESFRPGVMDKLGIGYQALSKENPSLVYCSVSAYGQTGPWKDKPGVDGIVQAVSGLMSNIGDADSPPMKVLVPAVDMVTGFLATTAVLAALRSRDATGRGQHLDQSLYNSAVMLQQSAVASYLSSGEIPARIIAGIGIEARIDGHGSGMPEHQRVPVGRAAGNRPRSHQSGAAGAIVDDDRLAEHARELFGDDARQRIDPAARRVRDDQGDRPRRVGLRDGAERRADDGSRGQRDERCPSSHLVPPTLRGIWVISSELMSLCLDQK